MVYLYLGGCILACILIMYITDKWKFPLSGLLQFLASTAALTCFSMLLVAALPSGCMGPRDDCAGEWDGKGGYTDCR